MAAVRESVSSTIAARRIFRRAAEQYAADGDQDRAAQMVRAASRSMAASRYADAEERSAIERADARDFTNYLAGKGAGGLMPDTETRDLGIGTGAGGGFIVPARLAAFLVKTETAVSPMMEQSRLIETPDAAPLTLPAVDDTAHVGAVQAENVSVGASTDFVTTSARTLGGLMYVSPILRYSWEARQDVAPSHVETVPGAVVPDGTSGSADRGGFSFEEELVTLQGDRLAARINTDLTLGAGTGGVPQGVALAGAVTPGVTLATGNAAAFSTGIIGFTALRQLRDSVPPRYWPDAIFMCSVAAASSIQGLLDGNGRPFFDADNNTIFGHQLVVNPDMPNQAASTAFVIFGSFKAGYVCRIAGPPVVKVLNERYADQRQSGLLIYQRVDGQLSGDTKALRSMVASAT